jgi:hypothetical protein
VDTASYIIEKFGGQSALARLLGKRPSTVQHWAGTGTIPAKWQGELLRVARERGIELSPSDFVEAPTLALFTAEEMAPSPPIARWSGELVLGEESIPCYVLDDGRRVISRTSATSVLTGIAKGGDLEGYLGIEPLAGYMPEDLTERFVEFVIPRIANSGRQIRGLTAETFLDICTAYVKAGKEGALKTDRQMSIALQAGMFLGACAKVGLMALIDEATGYQYERAEDALRLKLKLYLEDEMRQWEKTFPDELWKEFGRLTRWQGHVTKRPKYWGKLVMELVYEYLDKDVADWLRKNAPKPRGGQNYHQWLTSQYGLRKLTEHLWMLIGIASTCQSIHELQAKMAERFGKQPVQYVLWVDPPRKALPAPQ